MTVQTLAPSVAQIESPSNLGGLLQRKCGCGTCSKCKHKEKLQRSATSSASPDVAPPIVHEVLRSPGRPLEAATRALMESRFNRDFSDVRIHDNDKSAESARAVKARAYTVGNRIAFGRQQFAPNTRQGRELLAHELTHTIQQSRQNSRVETHLEVNRSGDRLEQEADRVAAGVVGGLASDSVRAVSETTAGRQSLQRYDLEDCDATQTRPIATAQRLAIQMLQKAIGRLKASPVTATTQAHFANHFGAYADWRRKIVLFHLERDLELFNASDMTYECESSCDSGRAYTYWIFGDIHLCPAWFSLASTVEQAETLIHELHHWDPARGHLDLGYHGNNRNANTTWIVAVNNADSYSELVQDLYEQP